MSKPEKKITFEDYCKQAKTFDIINCQHLKFPFNFIGHTAMIYKDSSTGAIMVYESTQMGHSGISGVQVTPFEIWLKAYNGKVWIRPIVYDMSIYTKHIIENTEAKCSLHMHEHRNTSYPEMKKISGIWRLVNAVLDLPFVNQFENIDDCSVQFCTDNTTDCYAYCSLARGFSSSEQEPDNMRAKGMVWTGADKFSKHLVKGISLSNIELRIK